MFTKLCPRHFDVLFFFSCSIRNKNCTYRPGTQQVDQEVATEASGEHLRDDVQVGHQSRLQDDGYVRGVEKLDGIRVVLSTITCRLDRQIDSEALIEGENIV